MTATGHAFYILAAGKTKSIPQSRPADRIDSPPKAPTEQNAADRKEG